MSPEFLVIAMLATYRLTIMFNSESGPGDIFGRMRSRIGVRYDEYSNPVASNWLAEGVLCYYCLSVWVAFAVVLLAVALWIFTFNMEVIKAVLLPFALSGGAIFLKKWGG